MEATSVPPRGEKVTLAILMFWEVSASRHTAEFSRAQKNIPFGCLIFLVGSLRRGEARRGGI